MLHTSIHIPCYAKNDKAQYTILFGLEISKLHRQSWPRTWPKTRQHNKKNAMHHKIHVNDGRMLGPCSCKLIKFEDGGVIYMINLHVTRESHWLWLMVFFVGKGPKRRLFWLKLWRIYSQSSGAQRLFLRGGESHLNNTSNWERCFVMLRDHALLVQHST